MNERLENRSTEHQDARREMRRLLLGLDVPNAEIIRVKYYETITLAEHEAARRALTSDPEAHNAGRNDDDG